MFHSTPVFFYSRTYCDKYYKRFRCRVLPLLSRNFIGLPKMSLLIFFSLYSSSSNQTNTHTVLCARAWAWIGRNMYPSTQMRQMFQIHSCRLWRARLLLLLCCVLLTSPLYRTHIYAKLCTIFWTNHIWYFYTLKRWVWWWRTFFQICTPQSEYLLCC